MVKNLSRALLFVVFCALTSCAALKNSTSSSSSAAAGDASGQESPDGMKKPLVSATRVAKNIFIGQVYPSGAVYLDVTDDRLEGKKRWPKIIKIYGLQSGTELKEGSASATLIGPLERVYPPEAELMAERSAECSAPKYHPDPALSYESAPSGGIREYFDRGASDNCSSFNVAKYFTSEKITKSFPVFAVAEYDVVGLDHSVLGTARPLSISERREVSQFHISDDEEDAKHAHFLEAASELVSFQLPATGLGARFSMFVNDRGEQRNRTFVLDIIDKKRVRKRSLRTVFQGSL